MIDFESVIEFAGLYIIAKDLDLRITYCSENLAKELGFQSSKEIIGKTDFDLYEEQVAQVFKDGDLNVLRGGVYINMVETQPKLKGMVTILTTKHPLRNKSGEVIGVVATFTDMTDVSKKLTSEILEYSPKRKRYFFTIDSRRESLTQREYSTFKYLIYGFTAKQVASELNLSRRTVECYINRLKKKFGCNTKSEITEKAIKLGILQENLISGTVVFGPGAQYSASFNDFQFRNSIKRSSPHCY